MVIGNSQDFGLMDFEKSLERLIFIEDTVSVSYLPLIDLVGQSL